MSEHTISYRKGGRDELGWILPVCSCGWEGTTHWAYNDRQHSNAREQAERHTKETTHD